MKQASLILLLLFAGSFARAQDALYDALKDQIDIVVDINGTGDHTDVQSAIDAVPNNSTTRTVIYIKKGRYYAKVRINSAKKNVVLLGEDLDETIITFDDYAAVSGFDCTTVKIDGDDFLAMNITFENGYDKRDSQALAVATYGDRQSFLHCRFNGYQDTYFSGSDKRAYFKDCLIIGDVDFIYGPTTILFDSCQIHNVRSGAYYTAASTPENHKFGYVFKNCWLSTGSGVANVWLGRPWRPYAHVVWYECHMSAGINPAGWHNWGNTDNEATARYEEYKCFGPGAATEKRVAWGKQLTDEVAATYTTENIYSKASNPSVSADWVPDYEDDPIYTVLKQQTKKFLSPELANGKLEDLKVNGTAMPNFHPDSLLMGVELPSGTTDIPLLEPVVSSDAITFEIEYPESLPGFAKVNIGTPYNIQDSRYKIYLSVDGAFTNANLGALEFYGESVQNFSPDDTTYLVGRPEDKPKFMKVVAMPEIEGAGRRIYYPADIPGQYRIEVTAVDQVTKKNYYVDVVEGEILNINSGSSGIELHFKNPIYQKFEGVVLSNSASKAKMLIYNTSGQVIANQHIACRNNEGLFSIDMSQWQAGIYLYILQTENSVLQGRLIKQ